jgi:hypothetical protein
MKTPCKIDSKISRGIQDSLIKGQAESFSKYVSQFTLFLSESHGGKCPEQKCAVDISMKTNVRLSVLFFDQCCNWKSILQSKTTSYDPFVLECVAFIHQQALAANDYYQLSVSTGDSDDSACHYRDSMLQIRTVCLQSLHQLVVRSSNNIKTAAPDLKLESQMMGPLMSDEDDSRSISERLFDEYAIPSLSFC